MDAHGFVTFQSGVERISRVPEQQGVHIRLVHISFGWQINLPCPKGSLRSHIIRTSDFPMQAR